MYIFKTKKNTFSDTCTHIHISDKRDFTLLSILSASSAAQLSNGSMCLLSSAVKTTGRDYRCFFSLLDSPLTPISHVLSAFKKNKKMSPYMYVNTRNRYVKYRAGTLIAVPVPTRNVRDNTRTRSKAFTLRSLYVQFACTITPKVCKFYVKK